MTPEPSALDAEVAVPPGDVPTEDALPPDRSADSAAEDSAAEDIAAEDRSADSAAEDIAAEDRSADSAAEDVAAEDRSADSAAEDVAAEDRSADSAAEDVAVEDVAVEDRAVEDRGAGEDSAGQESAADNHNGSIALLLGFVGLFVVLGFTRSWWIPGIVLGLMFMLFMHELGHYATARASGMKVTEFFLGFGPKIWSFNRGETEYGIKGLPAGAYVRIMGMTNLDEIDSFEEARTYRAQPWWQRMIVICAGSAMHFLMAFVALVVLFAAYAYPGFNVPWQVEYTVAGSTADAIGIEAGDEITAFNGETFDTWEQFGEIVTSTPVGPIVVEVERDGERQELRGDLGARSGDVVRHGFGIEMNQDRANQGWTIAFVAAGTNAESVGLEMGDVLVSVGGVEHPDQVELATILQSADGEPLDFVVENADGEATRSGVVSLDRTVPFRGFLGVKAEFPDPEDRTWTQSVGLAAQDFWIVARTNIVGLANMLNPLNLVDAISASPDEGNDGTGVDGAAPTASLPAGSSNPGGSQPDEGAGRPVSIIGVARMFAASESVPEVLFLFMIVNIFVGIFNLLPLLPLDGGHAALATYQKVRQLVTRNPAYRVDAAKLLPLTYLVIAGLVMFGLWAAILDIFAWPA